MSQVKNQTHNPFRSQRYPAVRAIVEVDGGEPSLADKVIDKVLAQIVRGDIVAGARLKSTKLAEELGVSRTPVATALAKLSADGILTQRNNYQSEVAAGAANWLVDVHKMRELMEPDAAAMAAGQIPAEVLEDLMMLGRDAKPSRTYDWRPAAEYMDFALHLSIAEFCGNLALKASIRKSWSYKRLSYEISEHCRTALKPEYNQHMAILQALVEGDAETAREQMLIHLQTATASRYAERIV